MHALFALLFMLVAIPPTPHAYVTDNVHALSPQANAQITRELTEYEQSTGHRVIVWIGDTTGDTSLEDWTIRAAEQWKIFKKKGRDDGAILFVFMKDHKVRIEVGYGLESTLTDAASSGIIRHAIVPKMRSGDVDGAIRDGIDRMLLTITPSYAGKIDHPVTNAGTPDRLSDVIAFLILLGIFIGAFIVIGAATSKRRGRKGWISGSGYSPWIGSFGGFSGGSSGGGFGGGFSGGFGGGGASGGW